jgi:hypothetical protein
MRRTVTLCSHPGNPTLRYDGRNAGPSSNTATSAPVITSCISRESALCRPSGCRPTLASPLAEGRLAGSAADFGGEEEGTQSAQGSSGRHCGQLGRSNVLRPHPRGPWVVRRRSHQSQSLNLSLSLSLSLARDSLTRSGTRSKARAGTTTRRPHPHSPDCGPDLSHPSRVRDQVHAGRAASGGAFCSVVRLYASTPSDSLEALHLSPERPMHGAHVYRTPLSLLPPAFRLTSFWRKQKAVPTPGCGPTSLFIPISWLLPIAAVQQPGTRGRAQQRWLQEPKARTTVPLWSGRPSASSS